MGFTKYIPDFLLPTESPQPPTRIYDAPLRRPLFQKAKEGNEHTVTASRNGSVSSERKESGASEWHPGMSFVVPYGMTSMSSQEHNHRFHLPHHHDEKHHSHGDFRMAD